MCWHGPVALTGSRHGGSVDAPRRVAHTGTLHLLHRHPVGLGRGWDDLARWLEAELIIDIKRELALLRQTLPDARITGSMLLPRWVWVGARNVTAVDKIRKVVNHEVVSVGSLLEGRACSGMAWQPDSMQGPLRTG